MKKHCFSIASVCFLAMMLFTACTQRFPGYQKTENGLYYKFYSHDAAAQKPKQTDVLKVAMTCYLGDSIYFDFQLRESVFPADLNEAYAMMHLGDSASFYIKADSVAIKYYDKQPESVGLKVDDYFRYEVKLLEIKPLEEFQAEIEKMNLTTLKVESERAFAEYVRANAIADHTPSGLYYSKSKVTHGASLRKGQKARIKFVASFLDGTPLGNSDEDGYFDVVYGDGSVLKGLDEGIGLMHVGEKARFVVPYSLAYGEQPYSNVPACSNLIFDVELIEIK